MKHLNDTLNKNCFQLFCPCSILNVFLLFFFFFQLSPSVSTFIHSVAFQPATDNRSNFSTDKAFHTFKKQR